MTRLQLSTVAFGLCLAVAACGDDDGLSGNRESDAGVAFDAGFHGDKAGNGAAASAGAEAFGDAGTEATDDAGFPVVACDNAAPVTECNGVPCEGPDPFAAQSCRAVCCTDDLQCGILASDGETCVAPAYSAGGCPSIVSALGTVSDSLAGCCTDVGTCGAVAFGQCVDRVKLGQDAMACPDLLDADAGTAP